MGSFTSTLLFNPQQPEDTGTPSEWDVVAVRAALMQRLPPELVHDILRQAEYWPRIHGFCSAHFEVQAVNNAEGFDAAYCCLITPPIPSSAKPVKTRQQTSNLPGFDNVNVRRRIETVTFKFTSRDQGWGGELGLTFPYAGSWTWFDAEIWRPTFSHTPTEVGSPMSSTASIKPMMESPTDQILRAAGYVRVPPPSAADTQPKGNTSGWLIQRNLRANESIQSHIVIWSDDNLVGYDSQYSHDNDDLGPSSLGPHFVNSSFGNEDSDDDPGLPELHGCGNGTDFTHSLQPGDRIAIVARAMYLGWSNRIHGGMSVDIAYSVS